MTKGVKAIPVRQSTDNPTGGPAIPVYGYTAVPPEGGQGGAALPVRVLTAADLRANGGTFDLAGDVQAIPVYDAPTGSPVQGGKPIAVYPVNGWGSAMLNAPPPGSQYDLARGVVSLRFDDSNAASYTVVYPELQSRGLVAGFPVVLAGALGLDTGANLTTAQALTMQAAGHEVMCHSRTHGADPVNTAAFIDESVGAGQDMRARGLRIYSFVQPGTWVGGGNHYNITTTAFYGSAEDLALRSFFACYDAYIGTNINPYTLRTLPNSASERYGGNHIVADTAWTLAQLKSAVDWAVMTGGGHEILIHPAQIGNTGLSLANFQALLDYIAAYKTAGLLDVLTPSQQQCGVGYQGAWTALRATEAANADCRIDSFNATSAQTADSDQIYASLWSAGRIFRWLARFDLSALSGKTLSNPNLYVVTPSTLNPSAWSAYRILAANSDWTRGQACWNTRKTGTAWAGSVGCSTANTDYSSTAMGTCAGGSMTSKMNYRLTLNAAEFAAMVTDNAGLVFRSDDEGTISAVTKGVASNYPADPTRVMRLVVLYQ